MSLAKHALMKREEQCRAVLDIAVEAGVLEQCENHDDMHLEGSSPIEEAYALGNSKWSSGHLPAGLFETRREMTERSKPQWRHTALTNVVPVPNTATSKTARPVQMRKPRLRPGLLARI